MLEIIEQVAADRLKLQTRDMSFVIQLSSTFHSYFLKELKALGRIDSTSNLSEIKIYFFDVEFTIINRSYRDDTNDIDVEKAICELISHSQMAKECNKF